MKLQKIQRYCDYARLTFEHTFPVQPKHGQYATINGKHYAIADVRDDSFDVYVKSNSTLFDDNSYNILGPSGPGFYNTHCHDAVVVAGGTGVGAVTSLLRSRRELGLRTQAILYVRNDLKVEEFLSPELTDTVRVWNTTKFGRPESPLSFVSGVPRGANVYVAGPSSLVNATKLIADTLHFGFHTNY